MNISMIIFFSFIYFYIEYRDNNEIHPLKALYCSISVHIPFLNNDIENNSTLSKTVQNIHNTVSTFCYYGSLI